MSGIPKQLHPFSDGAEGGEGAEDTKDAEGAEDADAEDAEDAEDAAKCDTVSIIFAAFAGQILFVFTIIALCIAYSLIIRWRRDQSSLMTRKLAKKGKLEVFNNIEEEVGSCSGEDLKFPSRHT
ncbi:hypothetical protein TELCIR_16749, partial [Teladorsagia circumcincta]